MGFPVTDITLSLGLEAIYKMTGPDIELCSAQMSSNKCIELTMHCPP